MRKLVYATAAAAVGLAMPVATAGAAMADEGDQPLVTALNGTCVAPWLWQLPVVTTVTGPENYANCDGPRVPKPQGSLAGVLDNGCVLPWNWEGPLDVGDAVLHPYRTGHYAACDDNHGAEMPQLPSTGQDDGIGDLDLVN